jgi:tetratricopeptide (TPR) repeat protein
MMTTEFLQGELERLFELESMMALSDELLGLPPTEVGGTNAKGAFARALVERCAANDALLALSDAIRLSTHRTGTDVGATSVPPPKDDELAPGSEVGSFRLVKPLAREALGTTYLAERLAPSNGHTERATVKVFRVEHCSRASASRLLTTARVLSQLRDAGLANVFEAGQLDDGRVYLASEYVEGQTLAERTAKGGSIGFGELRAILRTLLRGVATLHERGVLHGLLRADSVVIAQRDGEDGESYGVLTDLATSRLLSGTATETPHVLRLVGDPSTLAPEVIFGKAPDARSEVYSVGCLLYQGLTGQPVFEAASPFELTMAHVQEDPIAPSERNPHSRLPSAVDSVVLRALSKDPNQRFETVLDLADALESIGRSAFPPSAEVALSENELIEATVAFESNPGDAQTAAALEALVAPAHAWQQVVDTFSKAAELNEDAGIKKQLWFRSARILAHEMKDREAAEGFYRKVLELDASDAQARDAIEQLHRASKDYEGLAGLLIDRLDSESEPSTRARILREVAELYEEKLDQPESALLAYTQALAEDAEDESLKRAIERLASDAQWDEVLLTLGEAIENTDRPPHAVALCVLVAHWYQTYANRADAALNLLNRALHIDPAHEPALVALCKLYDHAEAYSDLVTLLVHRADSAATPALSRDLRAQAGQVAQDKLFDSELAKQLFSQVLAEDPSHALSLDALEEIYTQQEEAEPLAVLLESKQKTLRGEARVKALCKLAELYERNEQALTRAAECYRNALDIDERNLAALDGLVRVYSELSQPEELLSVLEQKLKATTTPTQRAGVLLQLATTHEVALADPEAAVARYEQIIEIAPGHDLANTALARLYRRLSRFEELAQTLDRHAKATENGTRKVDLLMQAARVLMADIGSPDRALFMCERVLAVSPDHPEALSLTSRMRALAGDTASAIDALELLADGENNTEKRADLWVRAGELLEQREDLDGAIDRYRLALDAVNDHQIALASLSRLYDRRGDLRGRAELLLRAVELASDPYERAQRLVELGNFRLDKLEDKGLASDAFASAHELDPYNLAAQLGLGRLSIERGDFELAAELLEPLLDHTTELSAALARDACVGAGTAFRELGQMGRAERAYLRAKAIAPNDREVLTQLSEIALENENFEDAAELLATLLERHSNALGTRERAEVLVKLGGCYRQLGSFGKAATAVAQASDLLPGWLEPVRTLCEIYESQGNWNALQGALKTHIDLSEDEDECFALMVKSADLYANQLKDRDNAARGYVAALELHADDRNVLAKLMAVYSEGKDWSRLVEVLVRMASVVQDQNLSAKYLHTAAGISDGELAQHERAVELYERALHAVPTLEPAFHGLRECLKRAADWSRLAGSYRNYIESGKATLDNARQAALWDELGELYAKRLSRIDEAVSAYEAAQELDPENRERTERLVEIYAKHPNRYGERAIQTHDKLLAQNPYRVESYKALRQLYTQLKRPDEAWLLCQALRGLNMAEPDEETFFKRYRVQAPATAQECVTEELWQDYLLHREQDLLLTSLFALMQPAAIQELAQPPEAFGLTPSDQVDCEQSDSVMAQMLYYAAGVTLVPLPAVFYRRGDAGGVSFLFTSPPSIGLGHGALSPAPDQALAFLAGRQLSYFRPGHYMRQLVPTGSGLRGWLLAAIRLANRRFPIPDAMRGTVDRNRDALARFLHVQQQQALTSCVERLLREQPEVDVKRWALAVDLTADRVGFVLGNSLDAAVAVMRASPADASMASERDRLKELYRYAVSPSYIALRQSVGIVIG